MSCQLNYHFERVIFSTLAIRPTKWVSFLGILLLWVLAAEKMEP